MAGVVELRVTTILTFFIGAWGLGAIAAAVSVLVLVGVLDRAVPLWAWMIVVAAMSVSIFAERLSHEKTKVAHAQVIADVATKTAEAHRLAVAAEQQVTERERALAETIESNAKEARRVQANLKADRDRADLAARGLRQQLNELTRRFGAGATPGADTVAAGQQPSAGDAIGVLADVLGRCDARAGILAAFADEAHAAGLACERNYDAARAALTPTLGLNSGGP